MIAAPPRLASLAAQGTVHFLGACGAGMAPLAELLLRSGASLSGCDATTGPAAPLLRRLGMHLTEGHDPEHVHGAAAVVYTPAVPDDHPELAEARELGVPLLKRAAALGDLVAEGRVVGVAGTHGKTTTSAMATHVLEGAGVDPTGIVGGEVRGWNGSLRPGGRGVFVVEADEYDRSFLHLAPEVAVVTAVEPDHLDTHGDLAGLRASFSLFLERVAPEGAIWVCGDDSGAARLGVHGGSRARSYGFGAGACLRALKLRPTPSGSSFEVFEDGARAGTFTVRMPGRHNVLNALAAIGVGRSFGAGWERIRSGLAAYRGVRRRYELLGNAGGVQVVDDYAHHPTEIAATLESARRRAPARRLVAVFEPHLYTRTRDLCGEFGRALALADATWVTEVYPARELPIEGVHGTLVAEATEAAGGKVSYHPELATLAAAVAGELAPGDVCVVMGAGSIERVAGELVELLSGGGR